MTFSFSADEPKFFLKLKKVFRHLIIPVFILYGIRIVLYIINEHEKIDSWHYYIAERINVLIFGSGVGVNIAGGIVPALGMTWFLIVLFCGRSLFDYMHLKLKTVHFFIMVGVCTAAGLIVATIQWLPLSFDIALAIMPFFLFSMVIKKIDMTRRAWLWLIISFLVWGAAFLYIYRVHGTYMELAVRRYPVFPLSYVAAIAGTMFVSYSSVYIAKLGFVGKGIVWLGRNSIYLFSVHEIDRYFSVLWKLTGNNVADGIIRIVVDIVFCIIVANIANLIISKIFRNG